MSESKITKYRFSGLFILVILLTNLPIWSVPRYINQDGSPHLYNAYIIVELLKGNPAFTQFYALNSVPIPNLTGHWLLAGLIALFPPSIVTKIIVTFLFTTFVAAIVWLRRQFAGNSDLTTTLLIATALAFNWMWFLGFYNFILGVIGFIFTLGLYWRWREKLNFLRCSVLAGLLIFVYFSHLISFLVLAGSLVLLALFTDPLSRKRAIVQTFLLLLPVLPLIVAYKLFSSEAGGKTIPVWRYLANPFSPSSWFFQLQTADPFQLLSRKAFPFVELNSNLFALFSPFVWIAAAFILLAAATWLTFSTKNFFTRRSLPFILLFVFSIVFWIAAPDDFGKSHGSFLRERVLLCGLIFFIPLFQAENSRRLKILAQCLLIFVIIFQTAALWQYSINADRIGREYLSGQTAITDNDSLGTIDLIENGCRYKANPLGNIQVLNGIGKNTRIWDNYEIGYYLFPVVAKKPSDRQFVFDFREASTFELCDPTENVPEKLAKLNSLLDLNHDKISVMLVWGKDERVEILLQKWFQEQPFFQNGNVRLFRHR